MASLQDRLKRIDAHSSVSKEFRVYTVHGAIVSVVTLCLIGYLVASEALFNFKVVKNQHVYVSATSPRGLEMEFDISLHSVSCSQLSIDSHDPTGQQQSLHLDKNHHVWKHRVEVDPIRGYVRRVLGEKTRIEMGSTLLDERSILANVVTKRAEQAESSDLNAATNETFKQPLFEVLDEECGSCYGAGEEGDCCNTCDDVKRAYKLKSWNIDDLSGIIQCREELLHKEKEIEGEGCNVHGRVALDSGGGNLHLAPSDGMTDGMHAAASLFDLLLQKFHEWNVTHTIHKLRFGPEYPDGVYQLDGQIRTVEDNHGMYQYYVQVRQTA